MSVEARYGVVDFADFADLADLADLFVDKQVCCVDFEWCTAINADRSCGADERCTGRRGRPIVPP